MTSPISNSDTSERTEAVIVVAHGSRNQAANLAHFELVDGLVSLCPGLEVRPAFLELAEPSIAVAIAALVEEGVDSIRLLPYFLHPGNHTSRDLPAAAEVAMETHQGLVVSVSAHFGADPGVLPILAHQVLQVGR